MISKKITILFSFLILLIACKAFYSNETYIMAHEISFNEGNSSLQNVDQDIIVLSDQSSDISVLEELQSYESFLSQVSAAKENTALFDLFTPVEATHFSGGAGLKGMEKFFAKKSILKMIFLDTSFQTNYYYLVVWKSPKIHFLNHFILFFEPSNNNFTDNLRWEKLATESQGSKKNIQHTLLIHGLRKPFSYGRDKFESYFVICFQKIPQGFYSLNEDYNFFNLDYFRLEINTVKLDLLSLFILGKSIKWKSVVRMNETILKNSKNFLDNYGFTNISYSVTKNFKGEESDWNKFKLSWVESLQIKYGCSNCILLDHECIEKFIAIILEDSIQICNKKEKIYLYNYNPWNKIKKLDLRSISKPQNKENLSKTLVKCLDFSQTLTSLVMGSDRPLISLNYQDARKPPEKKKLLKILNDSSKNINTENRTIVEESRLVIIRRNFLANPTKLLHFYIQSSIFCKINTSLLKNGWNVNGKYELDQFGKDGFLKAMQVNMNKETLKNMGKIASVRLNFEKLKIEFPKKNNQLVLGIGLFVNIIYFTNQDKDHLFDVTQTKIDHNLNLLSTIIPDLYLPCKKNCIFLWLSTTNISEKCIDSIDFKLSKLKNRLLSVKKLFTDFSNEINFEPVNLGLSFKKLRNGQITGILVNFFLKSTSKFNKDFKNYADKDIVAFSLLNADSHQIFANEFYRWFFIIQGFGFSSDERSIDIIKDMEKLRVKVILLKDSKQCAEIDLMKKIRIDSEKCQKLSQQKFYFNYDDFILICSNKENSYDITIFIWEREPNYSSTNSLLFFFSEIFSLNGFEDSSVEGRANLLDLKTTARIAEKVRDFAIQLSRGNLNISYLKFEKLNITSNFAGFIYSLHIQQENELEIICKNKLKTLYADAQNKDTLSLASIHSFTTNNKCILYPFTWSFNNQDNECFYYFSVFHLTDNAAMTKSKLSKLGFTGSEKNYENYYFTFSLAEQIENDKCCIDYCFFKIESKISNINATESIICTEGGSVISKEVLKLLINKNCFMNFACIMVERTARASAMQNLGIKIILVPFLTSELVKKKNFSAILHNKFLPQEDSIILTIFLNEHSQDAKIFMIFKKLRILILITFYWQNSHYNIELGVIEYLPRFMQLSTKQSAKISELDNGFFYFIALCWNKIRNSVSFNILITSKEIITTNQTKWTLISKSLKKIPTYINEFKLVTNWDKVAKYFKERTSKIWMNFNTFFFKQINIITNYWHNIAIKLPEKKVTNIFFQINSDVSPVFHTTFSDKLFWLADNTEFDKLALVCIFDYEFDSNFAAFSKRIDQHFIVLSTLLNKTNPNFYEDNDDFRKVYLQLIVIKSSYKYYYKIDIIIGQLSNLNIKNISYSCNFISLAKEFYNNFNSILDYIYAWRTKKRCYFLEDIFSFLNPYFISKKIIQPKSISIRLMNDGCLMKSINRNEIIISFCSNKKHFENMNHSMMFEMNAANSRKTKHNALKNKIYVTNEINSQLDIQFMGIFQSIYSLFNKYLSILGQVKPVEKYVKAIDSFKNNKIKKDFHYFT